MDKNSLKAYPYPYNAFLLLEDGKVFWGKSVGKKGKITGELCFTTAMTGYQHTITDPSFAGQIIVFTFPHIGNVGINTKDNEKTKAFCKGIVLREYPEISSHFLDEQVLTQWLEEHDIIGIAGLDTRALARYLRNHKSQNALIYSCLEIEKHYSEYLYNTPSMNNLELAKLVTGYNINSTYNSLQKRKIVLIDFGVKESIIRELKDYEVIIIPAGPNFAARALEYNPTGIVLSNGPGDPKATAQYASKEILQLIKADIPILAICLGHQLLALALGADTEKMSVGHRGSNHPVLNLSNKKIEITSQNHGFTVSFEKLPDTIEVTHISLFDKSIEGFKVRGKPITSVQYHPEGGPGPRDSYYIFKDFLAMVEAY